MCNSAIYTVNTTKVDLLANSQIPVGNVVRRFGKNLSLDGTGLVLCGQGYYSVHCNATLAADAAGDISVQLLLNGEQYQGAVATETAAAADDAVNLAIDSIVRVKGCCDAASTLTVQLGDAAASMINMTVSVEKL